MIFFYLYTDIIHVIEKLKNFENFRKLFFLFTSIFFKIFINSIFAKKYPRQSNYSQLHFILVLNFYLKTASNYR